MAMKNKAAVRFGFAAGQEIRKEIRRVTHNVAGQPRYTPEQIFYIELGAECAHATVCSMVGANNCGPTVRKFYIHSERKVKS